MHPLSLHSIQSPVRVNRWNLTQFGPTRVHQFFSAVNYARMFSGKHNSSWNVTTVQTVHPKVSEAEQLGTVTRLFTSSITRRKYLKKACISILTINDDSHPASATLKITLHMSVRHKRNSSETFPPTKHARFSKPKVQWRARTGTEQDSTQARISSSQLRCDVDISHANQANPHKMLAQKTLSNFENSGEESASLTQLTAS